jgi:acid phosphatase type 7
MTHPMLLLGVLASLTACNFDTSYHLVAPGDPVKYSLEHPELEWPTVKFDDGKWPLQGGDMQTPSCWTRCRFDIGPRHNAYRNLTLTLPGEGTYTAYINGVPLLSTSASGPSPMALPAGLLLASGNVLAIEYHAEDRDPFQVVPTLDGKPERGTADAPVISRGPYLLAARADGITIAWDTEPAMPSQVTVDGKTYDGGNGRHHRVRVSGLEASSAYPYQVKVGAHLGEKLTFTTAPRSGERVRFVLYGDTRTNGDVHRRLAQDIQAEGPDFLVTTGDLVGQSTQAEFDKFFAIEYALLAQVPMMAAIGNHETDFGDARDEFAELFAPEDAPLGRRVHSADYGDVHVSMLNSSGTLAEQVDWLDADLSAARARGLKHLIIAMHHGPFSAGTSVNHGSNGNARAHILPLAQRYGVALFVSGHDHFYERGEGGGIAYVVTGGGGAPLNAAGRILETRVSRAINHYVVVDAIGGRLRVTAKDLDGTTFDQFDIGG